jgi:alkylation response protein AidB-like acyl-CoA dehydrogenase
MTLHYTEDQRSLQSSLQRYLDKNYDFGQRQTLRAQGFHEGAWAVYADLGLLALPFAEADGGLGGRPIDMALVAQTMGAGLVLEPYVGAVVVCGKLLAPMADMQRRGLVEAVAAGALVLALAHHEPGVRYAAANVALRASPEGDGWRLHGAKCLVSAGMRAEQFLVSARTSGQPGEREGISLFLVPRDATGLRLRARTLIDGTHAADLWLQDVLVPAQALIGLAGTACAPIEEALDHGTVAMCADAVGVLHDALMATVDYLKTRKQFGVALGSLQAVQHRLAEMYVAVEQARSITELAALRLESEEAVVRQRHASAAKVLVGTNARFVGHHMVQLHGGMGVVDEMRVAHQFKRLLAFNAANGDVDFHRARYSALMND